MTAVPCFHEAIRSTTINQQGLASARTDANGRIKSHLQIRMQQHFVRLVNVEPRKHRNDFGSFESLLDQAAKVGGQGAVIPHDVLVENLVGRRKAVGQKVLGDLAKPREDEKDLIRCEQTDY